MIKVFISQPMKDKTDAQIKVDDLLDEAEK